MYDFFLVQNEQSPTGQWVVKATMSLSTNTSSPVLADGWELCTQEGVEPGYVKQPDGSYLAPQLEVGATVYTHGALKNEARDAQTSYNQAYLARWSKEVIEQLWPTYRREIDAFRREQLTISQLPAIKGAASVKFRTPSPTNEQILLYLTAIENKISEHAAYGEKLQSIYEQVCDEIDGLHVSELGDYSVNERYGELLAA